MLWCPTIMVGQSVRHLIFKENATKENTIYYNCIGLLPSTQSRFSPSYGHWFPLPPRTYILQFHATTNFIFVTVTFASSWWNYWRSIRVILPHPSLFSWLLPLSLQEFGGCQHYMRWTATRSSSIFFCDVTSRRPARLFTKRVIKRAIDILLNDLREW